MTASAKLDLDSIGAGIEIEIFKQTGKYFLVEVTEEADRAYSFKLREPRLKKLSKKQ